MKRQGDDGCIFYPQVACTDEKTLIDSSFLSKIVPVQS